MDPFYHNRILGRILLIGIAIAVGYWFLESFMDSLFGEGSFLTRLVRPDANELWMRVIIITLIITFSFYMQGATNRRKRFDIALQESERRFRAVFEHSPDAMLLFDPHDEEVLWRIIDCNDATLRINGYTRDELIGRGIAVLSTSNPNREACNTYTESLRTHGTIFGETVHRRKDGSLFPIEYSTSLVYFNGREYVLGVDRDISERKRAENQLRESEARLHGIIHSAMDAIITVDLDQRIVLFNPAAEQTFQCSATEMIGQSLDRLLPERYADADREHIRAFDRNHITGRSMGALQPLTARRAGGEEFPIEAAISQVEIGGQILYTAILRDITERRRADDQLRANEAQYRSLVDLAPDVIYKLDAQHGTFTALNPAFEALLGWSAGEWIDRSVTELIHPDDLALAQTIYAEVVSGGTPDPFELRIRSKTGTHIAMDLRAAPHVSGEHVVGVIGIARDITQRKQIEEQLHEANYRLQALIQQSPLAIVTLDPDSRVQSWNPAAERIFGWREQEVLGQPIPTVPEERQGEFRTIIERMLRGEIVTYLEVKRQRRDGAEIDVAVSEAPVRDPRGNITSVLAMFADITARKRAEEQLRQSEERYRLLVEGANDYAMLLLDANGRIISWNVGAERILGYQEAEILGQPIARIFTHDDVECDAPEHELTQAISKGRAEHERWHLRRDGTRFWAAGVVTPLQDTAGNLRGFAKIMRDITERKQAEELLRQHAERLRHLHALDQAILAEVSTENIAQAALHQLERLIPTHRSTVTLFNFTMNEATILASHLRGEGNMAPRQRFPLGAFESLEKLRQGSTLLIEDIRTLDRPTTMMQSLRSQGIVSYMSVPLNAGGELLGTLSFAANTASAFTADDRAIASEVADQLAIAIRHAQMFEQLQVSRDRLQILSRKLLEAQEQERQHIARELHDEVGQSLTAIKINVQQVERSVEAGALTVNLLLQETTGIVEHVLQQVRAMSLNLRPSVLDDLGLVSALRWMLHTQGQRAGVQTRFVADPPEMHLPPHIEITCFRVVQEAVTNVIRHAHATSISVEVYQRSAEVAVCIRDDGRGFDVDAAYERARQGKSLGVLGMQERVSLIGGALEIDSVPHHGSTIQVRIPLASNEGLTNEVGASRGSP